MTVTVVEASHIGGLRSQDSTYAGARAGSGSLFVAANDSNYGGIGQILRDPGNDWRCWEAFLQFDTSAIGTDTITAATLTLYSIYDQSIANFTIQARIHDWGAAPITTGDWVAGANLSGKTLVATYNTASGFAPGARVMTDVALPANINKTGTTYIILCADTTTNDDSPADDVDELVYLDWASAKYAKLTITHEASGSSATGAVTVPAATVAGTASQGYAATGALALTATTVAGVASQGYTASGALVLSAATVTGAASQAYTATGALTLVAPTMDGTGAFVISGTGALDLGATEVSGVGANGAYVPPEQAETTGGYYPRQRLQPQPKPSFKATGDIALHGPSVRGVGVYSDDDVVLEMLWLSDDALIGAL